VLKRRGYQAPVFFRVETVLRFAESLTFKGKNPVVQLIDKVYRNGVKLTQEAMAELEKQINRLPHLPKWFVEIPYQLT